MLLIYLCHLLYHLLINLDNNHLVGFLYHVYYSQNPTLAILDISNFLYVYPLKNLSFLFINEMNSSLQDNVLSPVIDLKKAIDIDLEYTGKYQISSINALVRLNKIFIIIFNSLNNTILCKNFLYIPKIVIHTIHICNYFVII